MKHKVFPYLLATAMMMAAAGNDKKIFDTGTRIVPSYKPHRDLPRWDVNGHIIFAKDEKTAENVKNNGFFHKKVLIFPESVAVVIYWRRTYPATPIIEKQFIV